MRVLTLGTFDVLHEGHINLLKACSLLAAGGLVTVGLNSDAFVKKYKGKAPMVPFTSRKSVLNACSYVYEVTENEGPGRWLIRRVKPDLLVIGTDWAQRDYYNQIEMTPLDLQRQGTLLVYVPYTFGISTSQLRGPNG